MDSIKFQIKGTEQQFGQMVLNCQMTEALFARTLAKRIAGLSAEDSEPLIQSWFESVRHMAQAQLMLSGIEAKVLAQ